MKPSDDHAPTDLEQRALTLLLFADGDGGGNGAPGVRIPTRRIHPAQVAGSLEPALALTVHKAQGSEAESVIVLLPGGESQDSRLLYTALTRARRQALLIHAALNRDPSREA